MNCLKWFKNILRNATKSNIFFLHLWMDSAVNLYRIDKLWYFSHVWMVFFQHFFQELYVLANNGNYSEKGNLLIWFYFISFVLVGKLKYFVDLLLLFDENVSNLFVAKNYQFLPKLLYYYILATNNNMLDFVKPNIWIL